MEEQNILPTIIVFGGANLSNKRSIENRIEIAKKFLTKDPNSSDLERELTRLKNLQSISNYYDSAREFAKIVSRQNQKT